MAYKSIHVGVLETFIGFFQFIHDLTSSTFDHISRLQETRSTTNMTINADHTSITACEEPADIALRNLSAPISSPRVSITEHYNMTDDCQQDPVTVSPTAPIPRNTTFTTAPTESSNNGDAVIQIGNSWTAAAGGDTSDEPPTFDIENAGSFSSERCTLIWVRFAHLR